MGSRKPNSGISQFWDLSSQHRGSLNYGISHLSILGSLNPGISQLWDLSSLNCGISRFLNYGISRLSIMGSLISQLWDLILWDLSIMGYLNYGISHLSTWDLSIPIMGSLNSGISQHGTSHLSILGFMISQEVFLSEIHIGKEIDSDPSISPPLFFQNERMWAFFFTGSAAVGAARRIRRPR